MKQLDVFLDAPSFCVKYAKVSSYGTVSYTTNRMKYFSEVYCKTPYDIVDKIRLKSKMLELRQKFSNFDKFGNPIFTEIENVLTVDLF